jgi:cystathionine beta-lyase
VMTIGFVCDRSKPATFMTFDFDQVPDRRKSDSIKWQRYGNKDVVPMWIADMDFPSPPPIIEAIRRRVEHGIFGYAQPLASTIESVVAMLEEGHQWKIDPSWIVWLPGLVIGLNVAARACAEPGEEILHFTPSLPPIVEAPTNGDRISRTVPLVLDSQNNSWEIDWAALEAAVTRSTRGLFLCHPHNPTGRVWRHDELNLIGEFCIRHNLYLCSDEVHCDLILDPALTHYPAGILDSVLANRTITLISPSKTYNLAGLGTALAIIPNDALRERFVREMSGVAAVANPIGYVACEAAYRDCEPWRMELVGYLRSNRDYLVKLVHSELPMIKIEAPIEATYLAWLNVGELHLGNPVAHFVKHGVALNDGSPFGAPKGEYVRLNFACSRATLAQGLARLKSAISSL